MLWSIAFACLLLVVVALKYLRPRGEQCPQCSAPREADLPLCRSCGWIYEAPGEEEEDYGDPEEERPWKPE